MRSRLDQLISLRVVDAFSEDQSLRRDVGALRISIRDGAVTLAGTMSSQAAKDRARLIAEGVAGVKRVENQLTVRRA
jgi:osmotically-inducible protein OsmY